MINNNGDKVTNLLISMSKRLIKLIDEYNKLTSELNYYKPNSTTASDFEKIKKLHNKISVFKNKDILDIYEYASHMSNLNIEKYIDNNDVDYTFVSSGDLEKELLAVHSKEMFVWVMIDGKRVELHIQYDDDAEINGKIELEIDKYKNKQLQKSNEQKKKKRKMTM